MNKNYLITGGAGFIGSNLCDALLKRKNFKIVCIDNFDEYYNPDIKRNNLSNAILKQNFKLIESDLTDLDKINIDDYKFDAIIHLAAKAGVRYSLKNPSGYEESNIVGTRRIMEFAVKHSIKKVIFASSSSIYGNTTPPFKEDFRDLNPISPYAMTKLISEKIGEEYATNFNIDFISLRFFSVYGPRLRPDLVMNKIANAIFNNQELSIFGDGLSARDYTYVDDIINGIILCLENSDIKGFDIFNLGNGTPIKLIKVIKMFESITGKSIKLKYLESIKGESEITWADNSKAKKILGFCPSTKIEDGIKKYLDWYEKNCLTNEKNYHK